jgi:hypothetical protein
MVSTAPDDAANETGVSQGVLVLPAGKQQKVPTADGDDDVRTCTLMFSSTPLMRPPTVTGDVTAAP